MITKLLGFGRLVPFVCSLVLAGALAACGGGEPTTQTPSSTGPTITTQPVSQTVTAGTTATFTVAATSTQAITYQWRRNGTNVAGANAATYSLPNTTVGDSGAVFSVVVTDPFGSVTSGNATLTVNSATPVITTQPANTTAADGQTASFSVVATNATSYQWRVDGANIAGANAATYLTPALSLADNGKVYSVAVTNAAGSITSNNATLTVVHAAPSVTNPANVTVSEGGSATFQVTATGSATITYQWQTAPNGSTTFADIPGATAAAYTVSSATLALTGQKYRVVATNPAGNVASQAATLTVTGTGVTITTQPVAVTVLDGQPATFSVAATGSGTLTYQWMLNGTDIPGANSTTFQIASTTLSNNGQDYSVRVANGFGSPVVSAVRRLTVNPVPVAITGQPAPTPAALEHGSITFTVTATGSDPKTYQWRRNGVDIPGATSASYQIADVLLADNGVSFTVVVDNAAGAPVTSNASVLSVTQTVFAPVISVNPQSQSKLEGDSVTFGLSLSAGTSPTYRWQKRPPAGTFADISPAETGATLSLTASYADNGAEYRVIVNSTPATTPATSAAATLTVTQQSVSVVAGQIGGFGNVDGPGSSALFSFPVGASIDGAGVTYVADFANHVIRKIATDGTTTTLAGRKGVQGDADGATGVGSFNSPQDVAAVPDGSAVYVADYANGLIRKVLANGTTSTLTLPVTFVLPRGLFLAGATTVDTGTLYVADSAQNIVAAIDLATSGATVIAGDGTNGDVDNAVGTLAKLGAPTDITVNVGNPASAADDIIYVADSQNNKIRVIDRSTGAVTTLVGTFGYQDGTAAAAQFNLPSGVALVGTDLYVTDTNNHVIRKVDLALANSNPGYVSTVAGAAFTPGNDDGTGAAARFFLPNGIVADPSGTRLVVVNFGNNIIDQISLPGLNSTALSGSASHRGYANGTGPAAKFNYPRGLASNSIGESFIADSVNHVIRKVTALGVTTLWAGTFGEIGAQDGPAQGGSTFNDPSGVAVDGMGRVYVADGGSSRIRMIDAAGTTVTTLAFGGVLSNPRALAVNAAGTELYVANGGTNQILRITGVGTTNTVSVLAGSGTRGSLDGALLTAQFAGPQGIAFDAVGNRLFVADTGNYAIRVINLGSNSVTTLAGNPLAPGTADGVGGAAQFSTLVSVAYDPVSTNLYVTDYTGHTLKRVTTNNGTVTTIVGDPASVGIQVGAVTTTPLDRRSLNGPTAVSIAPAETPAGTRLFVIDGTEHVLLKVTLFP